MSRSIRTALDGFNSARPYSEVQKMANIEDPIANHTFTICVLKMALSKHEELDIPAVARTRRVLEQLEAGMHLAKPGLAELINTSDSVSRNSLMGRLLYASCAPYLHGYGYIPEVCKMLEEMGFPKDQIVAMAMMNFD